MNLNNENSYVSNTISVLNMSYNLDLPKEYQDIQTHLFQIYSQILCSKK